MALVPASLDLPDLHAILRRQVQLLARLDLERRIPLVKVAHRLRAELRWCVHVGGKALAQRIVAYLGTPGLAEGDEETLVAGEPVDHRRGFAVERLVVGEVSDGQAGNVGDVFAQRLLATDVQAGQGFVFVELFRQLDKIDAVSKADVRRVANKIFIASNRTSAQIDFVPPQQKDPAPAKLPTPPTPAPAETGGAK